MGSRRRNLIILLLVLGLTAASALAIVREPTTLGLDLSGGTELVYQARPTPQNPEIEQDDLDRAIDIIRERTDELGVAEPEIARIGVDQIQVGLPDVQDTQRAIDQVGTTSQLFLYDYQRNLIENEPDLSVEQQGFPRLYDAVEFASKREPVPDSECEGCTATGPTFYMFDRDTLEPLAGPAELREDLFFEAGTEGKPDNAVILSVPQGTVVVADAPSGDNPETDADESETAPTNYVVLRDNPELTGDQIRNPEQQTDPAGQPNVTFEFTDAGRQAFQEVTERIALRGAENAPATICATPDEADAFSQNFAIVLDNEIVSRPIINFCENPAGIDGRTGAQISGSFTVQEAQDLAKFLQIGALPVKLTLISQSTVSATLGEEALDEGLTAGVAGLIVVLLFLVLYYRLLGVVAGLGLLVYALFFLALIKLIPVTLTLPGIAGLILTIGVAADANVVIFERIKEEARGGKSLPSAIATGYRRGIATIIDANVMILITAFILFVLATAGVKGFAFTLGIGTIVSLFTAVLFTQAILGVFGRSRILRSPTALGAGGEGRKWRFDFSGASRYFFSASGVILVIGALAFAGKQLNLGIDFESGTRINASLSEPATAAEVREVLNEDGIDGIDGADITESEQTEGTSFGQNVIKIEGKIPPAQTGQVRDALDEAFGLEEAGFDSTSVGPTFGEQIARTAVVAIVFSLLVIAAYVAIRFEAKYAIPVLIALIHDILITGGVYALVGREVTSGTVAAFLTILGYSMYDTVIVFDRIRENVPRMPRAAFTQIVNRSMSEVFTRSIITGASSVFLLAVLLVFGGETLQDFAFAMMVGVASGFYSSIFIASPVLTQWKEREPTYRSRRERIKEAMGYVPVFPEDNLVAKIDEVERHEAVAGAEARVPEPATPGAAAALAEGAAVRDGAETPAEPLPTGADGGPDGEPRDAPAAAADGGEGRRGRAGTRADRERRRKQRRKHGRPR